MSDGATLGFSTTAGRWVLAVTILGSAVASIEATVVNVALPEIGRDLGAEVSDLQWVLNGYLLTLAGLILLGGSLGDRYGRRRVFTIGIVWFTAASALCAVAPSVETLIGARVVQGAGAAMLTPGSLAIIESAFRREDRPRAIGAWSALGGVATAIGPLLGGYLVDAVSWATCSSPTSRPPSRCRTARSTAPHSGSVSSIADAASRRWLDGRRRGWPRASRRGAAPFAMR